MEKNKKTDSPAEIDILKTMVEYMKKVETYKNKTITGKDKKEFVLHQIQQAFPQMYDAYKSILSAVIDMVVYISKHKDILEGINVKSSIFNCCK